MQKGMNEEQQKGNHEKQLKKKNLKSHKTLPSKLVIINHPSKNAKIKLEEGAEEGAKEPQKEENSKFLIKSSISPNPTRKKSPKTLKMSTSQIEMIHKTFSNNIAKKIGAFEGNQIIVDHKEIQEKLKKMELKKSNINKNSSNNNLNHNEKKIQSNPPIDNKDNKILKNNNTNNNINFNLVENDPPITNSPNNNSYYYKYLNNNEALDNQIGSPNNNNENKVILVKKKNGFLNINSAKHRLSKRNESDQNTISNINSNNINPNDNNTTTQIPPTNDKLYNDINDLLFNYKDPSEGNASPLSTSLLSTSPSSSTIHQNNYTVAGLGVSPPNPKSRLLKIKIPISKTPPHKRSFYKISNKSISSSAVNLFGENEIQRLQMILKEKEIELNRLKNKLSSFNNNNNNNSIDNNSIDSNNTSNEDENSSGSPVMRRGSAVIVTDPVIEVIDDFLKNLEMY